METIGERRPERRGGDGIPPSTTCASQLDVVGAEIKQGKIDRIQVSVFDIKILSHTVKRE